MRMEKKPERLTSAFLDRYRDGICQILIENKLACGGRMKEVTLQNGGERVNMEFSQFVQLVREQDGTLRMGRKEGYTTSFVAQNFQLAGHELILSDESSTAILTPRAEWILKESSRRVESPAPSS
ncbi:MAG: hypothetical protein G01um101472_635 [Parcubacteria group bacterium Gr01-1014_72]|nr:MAG: hypothetical protein G01um101472_635 [Parcubacteria group bacterium Gr01-1014_72]